jgi:hypothetical protein
MTLIYDPEKKTLIPETFEGVKLIIPESIASTPWWLSWLSTRNNSENVDEKHTSSDIESIIRCGKENGVDKLELDLESDILQGIDVGGLEDLLGISIKIGQKKENRFRLKVKYKE